MTRKAILIESSNVKGHTELPGARVDLDNWKSFLKSDLGGAWNDSEIVPLRKPFSAEIENALNVDSDCYCFVTFSGHGREGSVVLNDHYENFPIHLLRPKSKKGTLIVDSCRGLSRGRTIPLSAAAAFANENLGRRVALNSKYGMATEFAGASEISEAKLLKNVILRVKNRERLDEAVSGKSDGVVEMLACSKGQAAQEDASAGGFYTSLLLQSADLWQEKSKSGEIQTTKEAHDYAASQLPPQQTPEYKPVWLSFPFAIKL